MKKYTRFITGSRYTENEKLTLDDHILIDIEMHIPDSIFGSSSTLQVFFPGVDQFKEDVVNILENEYGFEVIEDVYNGIKQKGHFSDRPDSISIYFDTYFDLSKSADAIRRVGVSNLKAPQSGKVYCFIHFRFSDHMLADEGDAEHIRFIKENAKKYTSKRSDLVQIIPEEEIELPEKLVYRYYDKAIEYLKTDLDTRIVSWVRKADILNSIDNDE